MSDQSAEDLFEPMCGQCSSFRPLTGYVAPGRHCLNEKSEFWRLPRKGWDKGCVEFEYKG